MATTSTLGERAAAPDAAAPDAAAPDAAAPDAAAPDAAAPDAAAPDAAPDAPASRGSLVPLVRVMRPYQWVKNFLLAVPLLMSHQWQDPRKLLHVALAFVAFSLCASSAYVLNDLKDVEDDRHHPLKRHRPFASGQLSRGAGLVLSAALLLLAFGLSVPLLSPKFTGMLGAYVVITLAYSLWLKQKLLVDVFVLAGLYTLRVLAGGAAIGINVTPWLLAFCIFFFLSLAFAKRYAELRRVQESDDKTVRGRAYQVEDLGILETVGPTSGYMAVLVLALYVNSDMAIQQYRWPFLLWFACPIILYWVTRVWFLAKRRSLTEDPLLFALKDRMSLVVAASIVALVVIAWGWPGRPPVP
jgi:4-hydroxybenzoate polyprenyltransferase